MPSVKNVTINFEDGTKWEGTTADFEKSMRYNFIVGYRAIQWSNFWASYHRDHGVGPHAKATSSSFRKAMASTPPPPEGPSSVGRKRRPRTPTFVQAEDTTGNVPASPDADSIGLGTATESD